LSAVSQDSYVCTGCQAKIFNYFRCRFCRYLYILYGFSLSFYRQKRIISQYCLVKRFVAFNAKYFTFVPAPAGRCAISCTAMHYDAGSQIGSPANSRISHQILILVEQTITLRNRRERYPMTVGRIESWLVLQDAIDRRIIASIPWWRCRKFQIYSGVMQLIYIPQGYIKDITGIAKVGFARFRYRAKDLFGIRVQVLIPEVDLNFKFRRQLCIGQCISVWDGCPKRQIMPASRADWAARAL
jgi:hypothetical protein